MTQKALVASLLTRVAARTPVVTLALLLAVAGLTAGPAGASARQQDDRSQATLRPWPVSRLEELSQAGRLGQGRTLSLRVGRPLPVVDVLFRLIRDTPFSVVVEPGVEGTFVGELKDLSLHEALGLVLFPLDLDFAIDRTVIRVFPRRMETRLFDAAHLQTVRAGHRTLRAGSGSVEGARTSGWSLEASETASLFEELGQGIQTLLSPGGRFNLDRRAGLAQVTDYPDRLERVALYLEAVAQSVTRQVELRALVVEVELGAGFESGVDWGAVMTALGRDPSAARTLGAGGAIGIDLAEPSALLDALGAQGVVDVLARPRVVAMNNEPAFVRVGRQPGHVGTTTGPAAVSGSDDLQLSSPQGGLAEELVLIVTPMIAADGLIQLSVSPTVTERGGTPASTAGGAESVTSVRQTDTLVRVRDGETIVLSGLMQARLEQKTDLVVLLMPRLVTPLLPESAPASRGSR